MKVKELIEELKKFDWDLEVVYAREWGSTDIDELVLMDCYMSYQKEVEKKRVRIYDKERDIHELEFKNGELPHSVIEL